VITVAAAPPYLTIQDGGRFGYRSIGVPPSGAMDSRTFRALNALLGNSPDAAMFEWALAGGTLRFDSRAAFCVGGARAGVTLNGMPVQPNLIYEARPGSELQVDRFHAGRFLYVAVRGGIDVPLVLGSRSTNMVAGFGGFEGRRLKRDDVLPVGKGKAVALTLPMAATVRPTRAENIVRIVPGPQAGLFTESTWKNFLDAVYLISVASDRMGYRLDGAPLQHTGAATLLSEPTCLGAIQAPHAGKPIVLMNDGPTVGGYPKIAVIVAEDLPAFVQYTPGTPVRFARTEI